MSVSVSRGYDGDARGPQWQEVGLAAAVAGREAAFPYLARSLENAQPAANTKVEWLVDGANGGRVVWFNWTQIHRTPFGVTNAARAYGGDLWEKTKTEMLGRHLQAVESTVRDGQLFERTSYHYDEEFGTWFPIVTRGMGGVKFYLHGREPIAADRIRLRILRDCVFVDRTQPDVDGRTGEFLSEFSLQVCPAVVLAAAA